MLRRCADDRPWVSLFLGQECFHPRLGLCAPGLEGVAHRSAVCCSLDWCDSWSPRTEWPKSWLRANPGPGSPWRRPRACRSTCKRGQKSFDDRVHRAHSWPHYCPGLPGDVQPDMCFSLDVSSRTCRMNDNTNGVPACVQWGHSGPALPATSGCRRLRRGRGLGAPRQ